MGLRKPLADTVDIFGDSQAPVSPTLTQPDPSAVQADAAQRNEDRRLSLTDRFIVQWVFDTQPKRREAYLKKLGFEMKPDDENVYRPAGSGIAWENAFEIDPGGYGNIAQYLKKDGWKEALADLGDGAGDLVSGTLEEGGRIAGFGLGFAAGGGPVSPVSGLALAAPASAGGASLGFLLAESGKDVIGDLLLDDSVPVEYAPRIMQMGMVAVAPEVLQAATSKALKGASSVLKKFKKGILNFAKISGGGLTDEMIEAAARRPDFYFDEANLSRAKEEIQGYLQQVLGKDPASKTSPKSIAEAGDSIFSQKMAKEASAREAQALALGQNGGASTPLNEVLNQLDLMAAQAKDNLKLGEEASTTAEYFAKKAQALKDKFAPEGVNPKDVTIPFNEMDNFVQGLQNDIYNKNVPGDKATLRLAEGQFNEKVKSIADNFGSPYRQHKEAMSELFSLYDEARSNINPNQIYNTIYDDPFRAAPTRPGLQQSVSGVGKENANLAAINTLDKIDQAFGTNLSTAVTDSQLRNQIRKNLERASSPSGSAGVFGAGATVAGGAAAITQAVTHDPTLAALAGAGGFAAGAQIARPGVAARTVAPLSAAERSLQRGAQNVSSPFAQLAEDVIAPQARSIPAPVAGALKEQAAQPMFSTDDMIKRQQQVKAEQEAAKLFSEDIFGED